MAGDTFKKVKKGDKLRIPAATYNAFLDAAQDLRRRQQDHGAAGEPSSRQVGTVLVKNTSGADADRFAVLGIDSPVFTPTDNLDGFKNKPVLNGVVPSSGGHTGKFVILLEPLAAGKLGTALVSGICPVKIDVTSESHTYADVKDGTVATLKSAPQGAAQILWRDIGTGEKWAVVRLGRAPVPGMLFPVKVTQTGGSAGDATNPCSFTYTVQTWDTEETLATDQSPVWARLFSVGKMNAATHGTAYYRQGTESSDLVLYQVDEQKTAVERSC